MEILQRARSHADTYDYLVNLNKRVLKVLENSGEISDGVSVDQNAIKYLLDYGQLARRNAQEAFMQLEFDF